MEIVLLIDEVNTSFENLANVRQQTKKFLLRNGGQLAQPVSLIFFTDSGTKCRAQLRPARLGTNCRSMPRPPMARTNIARLMSGSTQP